MDTPTVSVLLPVYNAESTIQRAVNSILHQTLIDFELIVVLNGCTDQTQSEVLKLNDRRIRLYNLPTPNLVKALNYGISKSSGKFIARMDADDFSHPSRLQTQVDFLQKNEHIGLVSGRVNFMGNKEENHGYYLHVEWLNTIKTPTQIYLSRFQECTLPHPSVMFNKSIGYKYGFYKKGDFPEDFELWNRWLYYGVIMSKVDDIVLDWHDSHQRLSRNCSNYDARNFSKVKASYFAKWFFKKFQSRIPKIYIWGTGSVVRRKVQCLIEEGLSISKFIDVKQSQSSSIIHFSELEFDEDIFVLNYVNDRKGKVEINRHLLKLGFIEGVSFYMME